MSSGVEQTEEGMDEGRRLLGQGQGDGGATAHCVGTWAFLKDFDFYENKSPWRRGTSPNGYEI